MKSKKDHWNYKHGYYGTELYSLWNRIKNRCYNKNKDNYHLYGGRGITMCDEWKREPLKFILWAKKNGWEKGLQIDRINNNRGYSPDNCRFVTCRQNILNTRLLNSKNTSGYCGVSYNKERKKWRAGIKINGSSFNLGDFDSPRLAALRRDVDAFINGYKLNFE